MAKERLEEGESERFSLVSPSPSSNVSTKDTILSIEQVLAAEAVTHSFHIPHNRPCAATLPNTMVPASPGNCYRTTKKKNVVFCVSTEAYVLTFLSLNNIKFCFLIFFLFLSSKGIN